LYYLHESGLEFPTLFLAIFKIEIFPETPENVHVKNLSRSDKMTSDVYSKMYPNVEMNVTIGHMAYIMTMLLYITVGPILSLYLTILTSENFSLNYVL